MLITFSGLDGAGKSTLIDCAAGTLARANRPAAVLHMNHDLGVYASLRWARNRLRHRGVSSTSRPRSGSDGASSPPRTGSAPRLLIRRVRQAIVWNKWLRTLLYPLDLMVFLVVRVYVERVRGRVLIMDRYFYDTLVDVSGGHRRSILRILHAITPTPSIAIYVDVTAEEAFARKGEYSIPYLQGRVSAYRAVLRWAPSTIVVRNTDLATSRHAVECLILQQTAAS